MLICDILLAINTNYLHPILHRFQVTANYWSNFRQQQGVVLLFLFIFYLFEFRIVTQ